MGGKSETSEGFLKPSVVIYFGGEDVRVVEERVCGGVTGGNEVLEWDLGGFELFCDFRSQFCTKGGADLSVEVGIWGVHEALLDFESCCKVSLKAYLC